MHFKHPSQFFLSTEGPCPYLPDQLERKLFATLGPHTAQTLQNELSLQGFRRSQNIVYKPACVNCGKCLSARIVAKDFPLKRSHKRILAKNTDLVHEIRNTQATDEQFELFERYVRTRHEEGGMSDMGLMEFAAMIEETSVAARIVEYRLVGENGRPGELIAACLTDILEDGVSMVYSFYDPDHSNRSLGKFMILHHLQLAERADLDHIYLGFWVKGSASMHYKASFSPLELYVNGAWARFDDPSEATPTPDSPQMIIERIKAEQLRQKSRG